MSEYTEEEMADVGRALIKAIEANMGGGWWPMDCPSEIVGDLCNKRDELQAEIDRLKQEKEYRYVEQVLSPIRRLLKVAEHAESMADNSQEIEADDGLGVFVQQQDFEELSDALDLLDELPDDKPGYVLGGAAKAEWALRDVLTPNAKLTGGGAND